jgi:hypothetical protein
MGIQRICLFIYSRTEGLEHSTDFVRSNKQDKGISMAVEREGRSGSQFLHDIASPTPNFAALHAQYQAATPLKAWIDFAVLNTGVSVTLYIPTRFSEW